MLDPAAGQERGKRPGDSGAYRCVVPTARILGHIVELVAAALAVIADKNAVLGRVVCKAAGALPVTIA